MTSPMRKLLSAMAPCILGVGFALWASMVHFILSSEQTLLDSLVLVLTRWFFLYLTASYLREHYRNTEIMLKQLSDFTVQGARCHCCNDGETCTAKVCDRAIIVRCLQTWYGSVEAFEVTVRTRVRAMLHHQLGGLLFPYSWQVIGSSPIVWGFADLIAARGRAGNWNVAGVLVLAALTWCFHVSLHLPSDSAFGKLFSPRTEPHLAGQAEKCRGGISGDCTVLSGSVDIKSHA